MKKWLIWFLVILLSLFPIFKERPLIAHANFGGGTGSVSAAPLPTRGEGVDVPSPTPVNSTVSNGAMCAMANVLTWEILQTYLYAITGQQAYDVYGNDSEKQETLYSDFATFCQEMGYGTSVMFEFNKNMAYVGAVNLKDVVSYYSTLLDIPDIESDLEEIKQASMKAMSEIMKNGIQPEFTPTPIPQSNKKGLKIAKLAGIGTLTGIIGKYITQLVNGERGEISEIFNNSMDISDYYFDGEYKLDNAGYPVFEVLADCYVTAKKVTDSVYMKKEDTSRLWSFRNENYEYSLNDVMALCMSNSMNIRETSDSDYKLFYGLSFYKYDDSKTEQFSLGNRFYRYNNGIWGTSGYSDLYVEVENVDNIKYIPVFLNKEDMTYFFKTGDYSKAVNAFDGEVIKPSDWLNYDFSQISEKLEQILKALTTLPTITTDDLAGFAQGVGNAIVAGNVPAADPATQQQQMQQILEDTARDTATRSLADSAMGTESETGGDDDTPRPTRTVEEYENDQTIQNGTMVVDWHEFFPFCVPYDMVRLIKVLNAEPQAPCFETAIKYDKLNINVPVKLDLSQFDKAAEIFRLCETIMFILGLILVTRNLIRG